MIVVGNGLCDSCSNHGCLYFTYHLYSWGTKILALKPYYGKLPRRRKTLNSNLSNSAFKNLSCVASYWCPEVAVYMLYIDL